MYLRVCPQVLVWSAWDRNHSSRDHPSLSIPFDVVSHRGQHNRRAFSEVARVLNRVPVDGGHLGHIDKQCAAIWLGDSESVCSEQIPCSTLGTCPSPLSIGFASDDSQLPWHSEVPVQSNPSIVHTYGHPPVHEQLWGSQGSLVLWSVCFDCSSLRVGTPYRHKNLTLVAAFDDVIDSSRREQL